MHDLIFENQDKLGDAVYRRYAEMLQLDLSQFDQCLDENRYSDNILQDQEAGQIYGVQGTPTFFINGRSVPGSANFEIFQSVIDDELDIISS